MTLAISGAHIGRHTLDYEYYKIIQELRALGISPTGDKNTDKARLEAEKQKLVEKITEKKAEISEEKELSFDDIVVQTYQVSAERQEMEEKLLGAMTIAEWNRIYFGI